MANDRVDNRAEEEQQAALQMQQMSKKQRARRRFLGWAASGAVSLVLGPLAESCFEGGNQTQNTMLQPPRLVGPTGTPAVAVPTLAPQGVFLENGAAKDERARQIYDGLSNKTISILALDTKRQTTRESPSRNFTVSLRTVSDDTGKPRGQYVVITDRDSGGLVVPRYDWKTGSEGEINSFVIVPLEGTSQTLVRSSNDGVLPGLNNIQESGLFNYVQLGDDGSAVFVYRRQTEVVPRFIMKALTPVPSSPGDPPVSFTEIITPKAHPPKFKKFDEALQYLRDNSDIYRYGEMTHEYKSKILASVALLEHLPPELMNLLLAVKVEDVRMQEGFEANFFDGGLRIGKALLDAPAGFTLPKFSGIWFHENAVHGNQEVTKCPIYGDLEYLAYYYQQVVTDLVVDRGVKEGRYGPDVVKDHQFYRSNSDPHSAIPRLRNRNYKTCNS